MHVRHVSADRHLVARRPFRGDLRRAPGRRFLATPVKTVTITEAKKHLGAYLKESVAGSAIGIICGNRIVALRPVAVTAIDFDPDGDPDIARLTPEQRDIVYARLKKERKEAKRRRRELLAGDPGA
jgi:hypothetical protein